MHQWFDLTIHAATLMIQFVMRCSNDYYFTRLGYYAQMPAYYLLSIIHYPLSIIYYLLKIEQLLALNNLY